jgi:photoactive yellow protein
MSKPNSSLTADTLFSIPGNQLSKIVEELSPDALDCLSFGVIRLDAAGRVSFFSRTEARQSGFGDRTAIGRKFFAELAPCMGASDFLRRVEQAQVAGTLDIIFEHVGDFDDADRELRVRMVSAAGEGTWVFLQRT